LFLIKKIAFSDIPPKLHLNMTLSPPQNNLPHPDWRASSPTVSDCDSGAFSRCSTPGFVFYTNSEQSPLLSPPLVLSVIKENTPHKYLRAKRLKLNPHLLLSCLSEAGKSSRFSSLQNLSTLHPMNTHKLQFCGSGAAEERVRGSLPHIWSRPGSNISWWWDNEFGGEDTDMRYGGREHNNKLQFGGEDTDTRYDGREQFTKFQFAAAQRLRAKQCDNNCDSQVTVNGQHLCSFT
jgi:hypothetical protein